MPGNFSMLKITSLQPMFYIFVILGNFPTKMFAILASITRNGGFLDFASRIYGESTHWVSSNTGTTIAVYKVLLKGITEVEQKFSGNIEKNN